MEEEPLLALKESLMCDDVVQDKSSDLKLVPWISWQEWHFVRDSLLFSSSPISVSSAIRRVSTWRSRGCLPVVIDVTASIVEIQHKDPFFRDDLPEEALESEEMLAMLYCMAIMRLVNCVVEKTRRKTDVSIAEAADAIGIPRMLIDVRHEGSHRDLPSLQLVRLASKKAVDWLISYYWEPQKNAIPDPGGLTNSVKKEIKHRLCELAHCLKTKHTAEKSTPPVKGSKIRITKALKNVLQLYSSSSSEVVSMLLEFLLKAVESSNSEECSENSQVVEMISSHTMFTDWKPIITKLSNKQPEILLALLKAVIDTIEKNMKDEMGDHLSSEYVAKSLQTRRLAVLFEWLVGILKILKPAQEKIFATMISSSSTDFLSKGTLQEVLCKCLLLSTPGNDRLMSSGLVLAQMMGNNSLVCKLKKLSSILAIDEEVSCSNSSDNNSRSVLSWHENSICQAAEKLEVIKLKQKRNSSKTAETESGNKSRWQIAKSWSPCPIGMLPAAVGSSGHLPVLDCTDDLNELPKSSNDEEQRRLNPCGGKRDAECATAHLDDSSVKKMRATEGVDAVAEENVEAEGGFELGDANMEDSTGYLLIDGVWKKVKEEEVTAIASAVRILV